MDVLAFIAIIAAIVVVTAGAVQVLDYIQKRRARQAAEQGQFQSSGVVPLAAPHQGGRQIKDPYSAYEIGLRQLLTQLGHGHPRHTEALVYQQRLSENIAETRRHGDTDTQESERAQIIEQLNAVALSVPSISMTASPLMWGETVTSCVPEEAKSTGLTPSTGELAGIFPSTEWTMALEMF